MKKAEFILYAYEFRSRAERVLWLLNELQFDYQLIRLNPIKEGGKNPEILKLNPQGKIPILMHKDKVFTDSLAMMEYLVNISLKPALIPSSAEENYRFRALIYYLLTEVEAYLWIADQCSRISAIYDWPEGTLEESVMRVKKSILHVYSFITKANFCMGEHFTIADIYTHHILTWAANYGVEHPIYVIDYLKRLESLASCPNEIKRYA